jgi:RNA polymerase sigma-70 factor (ECF subfamily)
MKPPAHNTTATFETLASEHYAAVLIAARSMSRTVPSLAAEDLAQDSFLAAYNRFDRYDPSRPFIHWMNGIMRHRMLRHINDRHRREIPVEPKTFEMNAFSSSETNEAEDTNVKLRILNECVRLLPIRLRQAIELFHFQNLSGIEVANRLHMSQIAIRGRLHRGRHQLKKLIQARLNSYV